jgi:hypothetical protein
LAFTVAHDLGKYGHFAKTDKIPIRDHALKTIRDHALKT